MTIADVLEILARLRRDAFGSRAPFAGFALADTDASRGRRLWRRLRALERDLAAPHVAPTLSVHLDVQRCDEGARRVAFEVEEIELRHSALLAAEEYELLRQHPDARAVLDRVEVRRGGIKSQAK